MDTAKTMTRTGWCVRVYLILEAVMVLGIAVVGILVASMPIMLAVNHMYASMMLLAFCVISLMPIAVFSGLLFQRSASQRDLNWLLGICSLNLIGCVMPKMSGFLLPGALLAPQPLLFGITLEGLIGLEKISETVWNFLPMLIWVLLLLGTLVALGIHKRKMA